MNDATEDLFRRLVPPVAAVVLLVAFVSLGFWQLDRAAQKEALESLFETAAPRETLSADMPFVPFKPVRAKGRYLLERQILIDNMVVDGRLGYYVLTPLEIAAGEPLLIVNRGWIERPASGLPEIPVADAPLTLEGRMGQPPRVGIRPGPAFAGEQGWPRTGVFPTLDEIAAELGREVMPFALLLDPDPDAGMIRRWKPRESGPMMHYGYAFQWFALAAAVVVVTVWQLRKGRRRGGSE